MSSALVINLTRFGDLIQSQAVIDDLHQEGYQTHLLCQNNFAEALSLLRNVSSSWLLPGARLLSDLGTDWKKAFGDLSGFCQQVKETFAPDVILNLTPTLPARILSSMLADSKTQILGFGMDAYGYGINHGVWASFFSVAAGRRANSPFNLADLMRFLALPVTKKFRGSFRLARPGSDSMKWAQDFISASGPVKGYIAFQLGASQNDRRWPIEKFRELGEILWQERNLAPILLGSPAEIALGAEYASGCAHPFVNAIGKTDIPALAALLTEANLLVTNDTGTMHLAAGLERPVLSLFLATAQPWDTGPLMPGSISLEPDLACHPCAFDSRCDQNNKCLNHIDVRTVANYALAQLDGRDLEGIPNNTARAWQTEQDATGLTQIRALNRAGSGPGIWLTWQRTFWQILFADMEQLQVTAIENLKDIYAELPPLARGFKLRSELEQAAVIFKTISEISPLAVSNPKMAEILLRNSERIQALLDVSTFDALASFWRELRLNQGGDLERFGRQAGILAAHVKAFASSMA